MRLTRQTNYAMRILMYCAANDGRLSRIPEIATAYSVSELFLFKILQPLVEAGLVETVRGRNGGVRLGRPADKITLFDVGLARIDGIDGALAYVHTDHLLATGGEHRGCRQPDVPQADHGNGTDVACLL